MSIREKYANEMAKILNDARKSKNWALDFGFKGGQRVLINCDSSPKDILNTISVFTLDEFDNLTKGFEDLEIKDLERQNPYSTKREKDGIYIEKCSPMDAMGYGRDYAIVKDNKKMLAALNTKTKKHTSIVIMERYDEGIYLYSSDTDEIRFISMEELSELCNYWRVNTGEKNLTDSEIIDGLTESSRLFSLLSKGTLLANRVSNNEPISEEKANSMFRIGLKEYMRINNARVTEEYENELSNVTSWTR